MTWFVNLRSAAVAGTVVDPVLVEARDLAQPDRLRLVPAPERQRALDGRDVVLVAHGFNVNRAKGVAQLGRLAQSLMRGVPGAPPLPATTVVLGVLWPGDFWIPVVNYPFEGSTATECGKRLATWCDTALGGARSVSFISHSLGARLVLAAAGQMRRDPALLCLTAAAVNAGILTLQSAYAAQRVARLYSLASKGDQVLRLAFPVGDWLGDLLDQDDGRHGEPALGYKGAMPRNQPPWLVDRCYAATAGIDHGDYLPPDSGPVGAPGAWQGPAAFMAQAMFGQAPTAP